MMKIRIIACLFTLLCCQYVIKAQGFSSPASQWNIPVVTDTNEYRIAYDYHAVIDMNGDGKPDLVDSENEATNSVSDVFLNGNQKYWKVYLNTGTGFSSTAIQWSIPVVSDTNEYRIAYDFHQIIDMNGDGKPDFVDSENEATNAVSDVFLNGNQKYWKVYLNTGTGFSSTATQWNIPVVSDSNEYRIAYDYHQLVDFDGDGKPDFIDSENEATNSVSDVFLNGNQKYWKVYLNTGAGFSPTATQWNIPIISDTNEYRVAYDFHQVIDMNGDRKPDFVDSENQSTETVSDVFLSGNQKYWKVYLNTGTGFSTTAIQWNIPIVSDTNDFRVGYDYHTVIDFDGDLKPDFIDSENEATSTVSDVFLNGNQKYWKVYLNTGAGFSSTATQWNIPIVSDTNDYRVGYDYHTVIDFDGDLKPDFIDSENQSTETASDVFLNGSQKYWKVYLNNAITMGNEVFSNSNINKISCHPNPVKNNLNISSDMVIDSISIYNLLGQEVMTKSIHATVAVIDFSSLLSGTYLVKIASAEVLKTLKILKE